MVKMGKQNQKSINQKKEYFLLKSKLAGLKLDLCRAHNRLSEKAKEVKSLDSKSYEYRKMKKTMYHYENDTICLVNKIYKLEKL